MQKHISVFGFYIRSSIYRVLLILLLMVLAVTGVFLFEFQGEMARYYELLEQVALGNAEAAYLARPEKLFDNRLILVLFELANIAVTIMLVLPGCEFKAKTTYTIKRLQVSERAWFFWQVLCSAMTYLLVYAAQLAVIIGLSQYYVNHVPAELVGNQSIFLMFYRSELLHSLLPLSDIQIWIRNILLLLGFSFAVAGYSYQQRRKKHPMALYWMITSATFFFRQEIAGFSNVMLLSLVSLMVITKLLFTVLQEEEEVPA